MHLLSSVCYLLSSRLIHLLHCFWLSSLSGIRLSSLYLTCLALMSLWGQKMKTNEWHESSNPLSVLWCNRESWGKTWFEGWFPKFLVNDCFCFFFRVSPLCLSSVSLLLLSSSLYPPSLSPSTQLSYCTSPFVLFISILFSFLLCRRSHVKLHENPRGTNSTWHSLWKANPRQMTKTRRRRQRQQEQRGNN